MVYDETKRLYIVPALDTADGTLTHTHEIRQGDAADDHIWTEVDETQSFPIGPVPADEFLSHGITVFDPDVKTWRGKMKEKHFEDYPIEGHLMPSGAGTKVKPQPLGNDAHDYEFEIREPYVDGIKVRYAEAAVLANLDPSDLALINDAAVSSFLRQIDKAIGDLVGNKQSKGALNELLLLIARAEFTEEINFPIPPIDDPADDKEPIFTETITDSLSSKAAHLDEFDRLRVQMFALVEKLEEHKAVLEERMAALPIDFAPEASDGPVPVPEQELEPLREHETTFPASRQTTEATFNYTFIEGSIEKVVGSWDPADHEGHDYSINDDGTFTITFSRG